MALFENFPYTNLHELNLDWLIQEMKELEQKVQDGPVVSVNGLTGVVTLYRESNIQFPDITDPTVTKWEMFRYLNGNIYGIQFDNNGNVYALRDFVRTKLLTWDDIPPDAGVISVNGLYGVVHLSGTDIPYMGGETETVFDKLSDLDDDITSAQADINDISVTMSTIDNAIKRGIAYLESTDTAVNNIPAGKYVFWKNGAYIATSAISAGDTLSSTNLSQVSTGGFINALKDELITQIATLNNKIKYHYDAYSPTLPSNVTGQGANPTQYFYSSSVVSVKISFKITDVTQTGYPGRVEIPHNIPASYAPPYEIQFAGGNGEGNGITPGTINSTNIIIYPMKTGTTYCQATITYIPSLI